MRWLKKLLGIKIPKHLTYSQLTVLEEIRYALRKNFARTGVKATQSFHRDLGFLHGDMCDLVMELEEMFDIIIFDDDYEDIRTIEELVILVDKKISER